MTNPKIETDIAEVFGEIRQELKSINNRLTNIEIGQEEIKGEIKTLSANQDNFKEQLLEVKGSQKYQIWTLIGILATALLGILVAGGRILFFAPKV